MTDSDKPKGGYQKRGYKNRGPRQNLVGTKFGRWHVQEYAGNGRWLCRCECGTESTVVTTQLKSGKSLSCGCLCSDVCRAAKTTHGKAESREYSCWLGMKARCENPASTHYDRYGGRGILPCAAMLHFEHFYKILGERPLGDYSIDRIDNDGGYWCGECDECYSANRPRNVRWATRTEQSRNRSVARLIEYDGQKVSLTVLAERYGIAASALRTRLELGWAVEKALTVPSGSTRCSVEQCDAITEQYRNGTQTVAEIANEYGLKRWNVYAMLKHRGASPGNRRDKNGKFIDVRANAN